MKELYFYDKTTKEFLGSNVVADDYIVSDGETEIAPTEGLIQPATFDGTKWIGTDKTVYNAEIEKKRQNNLIEHPEWFRPSTSEKVLAQITLQMATEKNMQDKLNAQLLLASATQQSTN